MRAALIFRLARARRCAIAGSATRKDRATSVVDSPPSSRRVSATCASVESAGWQQVKMRKPAVLHPPYLLGRAGIVVAGREHRHLAEQFPSTRLAAQAVDRTVAGGCRDPAARFGRQ